jgi:hypothetical protein
MPGAPLSSDVPDTRSMLERAASVHGDIEAYVEPGARITFAESKTNALTLISAAAMLAWRVSQHVVTRSASTP